MAEPLKNLYGAEVPRRIAAMIGAVHPAFDGKAFLKTALNGYEALALMPRGSHIADALHAHLPRDYPMAIRIVLASLNEPAHLRAGNALASFLFLPHTLFVAKYGLQHFELSMQAQHTLTQRFSAEFSIRKFIEQNQILALAFLRQWATDPSEHVRRLVSEGTRPRLPWAQRLRDFQRDPRPVVELLELLKDDASLYVRRSVANNLNDIGKDHPDVMIAVAERWLKGANENRRWIVRHALRSAVERGEPGALRLMGFGDSAKVAIHASKITPVRVKKGATATIAFQVAGTAKTTQHLLVDLKVHFVKANGKSNAKVFKLRELDLPSHTTALFAKRLSLKDLTTRKHYPGVHRVEAIINGHAYPVGQFTLVL